MPNLLIQRNGQPHYGIHTNIFDDINHLDFDWRTPMGRKRSQFAKRMGFNQFEFLSLMNESLIIGCAIVDLKWVSNAFVYLYDVTQKRLFEKSFLQPLARKTKIETSPLTGSASFRKGKNRLEITASQTPSQRSLHVQIGSDVEIVAILQEPAGFKPLSICTRAGFRGWNFTQKANALPVIGNVKWGNNNYDLANLTTLGAYDYSCGFMRRETSWSWASLSGFNSEKKRIGFNFSAGVLETSFTENGFWIDDKFTKVDLVNFNFDPYREDSTWYITSNDKKVNLQFTPEKKRAEKINALFIASNFKQFVGKFSGKLITDHNQVISLDGIYGLTEDHYAKW